MSDTKPQTLRTQTHKLVGRQQASRPTDRENTHARGAAEDLRISEPHFAAQFKPR